MKLKTAKKDIVCYKVANKHLCYEKTFESFYYHYKYTLGRKVSKRTPFKIIMSTWDKYKGVIKKGFHSYTRKPFPANQRIKCIIPKGSQYYVNTKDGTRVSNAIKPIGYFKN